jgi:hypothetical protein
MNRTATSPRATRPATPEQEAYYDSLCAEGAVRRELAGLIRQEAALQGQRADVEQAVVRRIERARTLPWYLRAVEQLTHKEGYRWHTV